MHCYLLPLAAMLFLSPGLIAQPSDPIRAKLDDAKQKHTAAQAKQREDIREALDKKEATARAGGDKKAVDALLEQRKAFETDGTILPLFQRPSGPTQQRRTARFLPRSTRRSRHTSEPRTTKKPN